MNETIKTILSRKSCKSYEGQKKVDKKDIALIVDCGRYAPSAMNAQSWHFTVITSEKVLSELNSAVFDAVDDEAKQRIISRSDNNTFNFFYNAPAFIIVSCPPASPFPFSSCACALENMQIAAESLGLNSCWINQLTFPLCDKTPIRNFLNKCGVQEENKVYGCLALGYAKKEPAQKERAQNTVSWIE